WRYSAKKMPRRDGFYFSSLSGFPFESTATGEMINHRFVAEVAVFPPSKMSAPPFGIETLHAMLRFVRTPKPLPAAVEPASVEVAPIKSLNEPRLIFGSRLT